MKSCRGVDLTSGEVAASGFVEFDTAIHEHPAHALGVLQLRGDQPLEGLPNDRIGAVFTQRQQAAHGACLRERMVRFSRGRIANPAIRSQQVEEVTLKALLSLGQ